MPHMSMELKQAARMRHSSELTQTLCSRVQLERARGQRGVAVWADKMADLHDFQERTIRHATAELPLK
eukprot:3041223-Amphidinium_carterae.1